MTKEQPIKKAFGLETNKSRFAPESDFLPWLKTDYKIDELINDFWGLQTKSRLVAVTKDLDDKQWRGLVSEWDSFTEQAGQFRLNKEFIKNVLDLSLGETNMPLELKNLTELELAIFENFFVELENFWKDYWRVAKPNSYGTLNFLIWAIELDNQQIGSLAIGIPSGLIPKQAIPTHPGINIRELAKELNVEIPIDLLAGKTCLTIQNITNIENDDLIVFEQSDINHLIWEKNKLQKLEINLTLPDKQDPKWDNLYYEDIDFDETKEENTMNNDLLTDLPVELTAQFKSVNMPLQKIMELEVGGVLPLDLLLDNELVLMAPGGKPIAQGELVIVGNKFGLKITKINLKSGHIPKSKLSSPPPIDHSLLDQAVSSGAASEEPTDLSLAESSEEDISDLQSELDEIPGSFGDDDVSQEQKSKKDKENINKELEDVGIDPDDLDDLEDLY